jgi:protein SCO1/2
MVRTSKIRVRRHRIAFRRIATAGRCLSLSAARAALLALPALLLAACSEKTAGVAKDAGTTYEVRGLVRDLEPADSTLIIEHEDIPGFMPSMTMPFTVRPTAEMEGVQVGDALSFDFVVREDGSWIHNLRPAKAADLVLPEPKPRRIVEAKHVKEGDSMPTFELIDHRGRKIDQETFEGRQFVLTFVFTRCAVPDFCPLMSNRFAKLESLIRTQPGLLERTSLLSVSIDPEYDTPEVLDAYADRYSKDDNFWRFATGDPNEVAKLIKAFRVHTETAGGTLSHGLCTALVGADGTVRAIWRGNVWEPEEVFSALTKATAP